MVYLSSWSIPDRFCRVTIGEYEAESVLVGVKIGELPIFQLIATDGKERVWACILKKESDFKTLFSLNNIYSVDKDTIQQMLKQLKTIESAINNDNELEIDVDLGKLPLVTLRRGDFQVKVPLEELESSDDKLPVFQQLLHKLIEFSSLQSRILSKEQAEIDNKNQIIMKFLVDRIQNLGTILGTEEGHEMTDKEIFNHEAVKSMFLTNGGLKRSLGTSPESIRRKVTERFETESEELRLQTIFNKEFAPQWKAIAGTTQGEEEETATVSKTTYIKQEEDGLDKVAPGKKRTAFQLLLGAKKRKA